MFHNIILFSEFRIHRVLKRSHENFRSINFRIRMERRKKSRRCMRTQCLLIFPIITWSLVRYRSRKNSCVRHGSISEAKQLHEKKSNEFSIFHKAWKILNITEERKWGLDITDFEFLLKKKLLHPWLFFMQKCTLDLLHRVITNPSSLQRWHDKKGLIFNDARW